MLDTFPDRDGGEDATPQPLRALRAANHRRANIAELKRRLHRGELTLAELVLRPPEDARSYLVFEVLLWGSHCGPSRLQSLNARALRRCEVNLAAPLGALTDRQRRWLAGELEGQR